MTGPVSLRATAAAFARGWQNFFHAPCDARVCALVRIGVAVVFLVNFAVLYPDLNRWFTAEGVLHAETLKDIGSPYAWSLLRSLPDTPLVVHLCFWTAVIHNLLLLAGVLPRLNALCLFLWIYSFQTRNPLIMDGQDTVMRMAVFFLIFIPSDRCWSLTALVRRLLKLPPRGNAGWSLAAPGWGLRLLQIQTALIFLSTGLMKLGGQEWIDGTAIYYVARLGDFFGRFPVPAWPFDTPWTVALMTWSVMAAELTIPLLVWFRETRRWCLLVALVFHLANEWTMHLFLFHWIMLASWLSFITSDDLTALGLARTHKDQRA
jgi:HTTM domain